MYTAIERLGDIGRAVKLICWTYGWTDLRQGYAYLSPLIVLLGESEACRVALYTKDKLAPILDWAIQGHLMEEVGEAKHLEKAEESRWNQWLLAETAYEREWFFEVWEQVVNQKEEESQWDCWLEEVEAAKRVDDGLRSFAATLGTKAEAVGFTAEGGIREGRETYEDAWLKHLRQFRQFDLNERRRWFAWKSNFDRCVKGARRATQDFEVSSLIHDCVLAELEHARWGSEI